jgi:hypothetical protein
MPANEPQGGARDELRRAIREMQVAAVIALSHRLHVSVDAESAGRLVAQKGIKAAIGEIEYRRPSLLARFFNLFSRH